MSDKELTENIIKCAIEVHRNLGPGLLENAYSKCLEYEFDKNNIKYMKEVYLPINYKGMKIDCSYRADFVVEDRVILELKSVGNILDIHKAQLLTYLKISNKQIGFLINFNETLLKKGITRMVNDYKVK